MKNLLIIIFSIISIQISAQKYDKDYFQSPVKIPIRLAGNFGEIRPNHFHSGIDIKVPYSGVTLYAAADGYISRIRKSADGYGNALYITHPNGLMTVYGHMNNFNKVLEKYADSIQYSVNQFEFTEYPDSVKLKIKKGEIIGNAGNTGRSFGPHLHFEIREVEKEIPINPCYFNFAISDNIPPKIFNLAVYPMEENGTVENSSEKKIYPVQKKGSNYYFYKTITYTGKIGFAVRANDYLNGVKNSQGIYEIKLFLDDELIYNHVLDKISFEESRYINSFIDFEEKQTTNLNFQKCFIEPGNRLDIYKTHKNQGIISSFDEQIHNIRIEVSDIYGNITSLFLKISGKKAFNTKLNKDLFFYDKDNFLEKPNFRAYLKKGALYKNIEKTYKVNPGYKPLNSDIHSLNSYKTPIHDDIHIAIKPINLPKELINKALIVRIDKNGRFYPLEGNFMNDFFVSRTNQFGDFAVTTDTTPPEIKEENFNSDKNFSSENKISLIISDNLSGIKNYTAKIDNKSIIFTYDIKNNRIYYIFDNRIEFNKSHNLIITLFDQKNNKTVYKTNFFK